MAQSMALRNVNNKVGSSAITIIDFDSFIVKKKPTIKRKSRVKTIINENFKVYSEIVEDIFWKEKLSEAAHGKFPPKFVYHDNTLGYKKGNKMFKIILSEEPFIAINQCIDFFKTHGGIYSPEDLEHIETVRKDVKPIVVTWMNSCKDIKDTLMSYYVIDLTKQFSLNSKEINQLKEIIYIGLLTKKFNKNNIIICDNRIKNIQGLLWDDLQRIFYIDSKLNSCKTSSSNKSSKNSDKSPKWYKSWDNFLDKIIAKSNKSLNASFNRITDTVDTDTVNTIDTDTDTDSELEDD